MTNTIGLPFSKHPPVLFEQPPSGQDRMDCVPKNARQGDCKRRVNRRANNEIKSTGNNSGMEYRNTKGRY